jgi:hypothetical protein
MLLDKCIDGTVVELKRVTGVLVVFRQLREVELFEFMVPQL